MQLTNFKLYTRWILLDDEDRILLIKKSATSKIAPNKLLCPWWTVELWETIEQTIVREIEEEIGIRVQIKAQLWVRNIFLWDTQRLWVYYYIEWDYAGSYNREPDKHDFIKFYSQEDIELISLDEFEKAERGFYKQALQIKHNLTLNK